MPVPIAATRLPNVSAALAPFARPSSKAPVSSPRTTRSAPTTDSPAIQLLQLFLGLLPSISPLSHDFPLLAPGLAFLGGVLEREILEIWQFLSPHEGGYVPRHPCPSVVFALGMTGSSLG